MKEIKLNIKKIKDQVFFSIPVEEWDPAENTEIKAYLHSGVLTIPLHSFVIGFSEDEINILQKIASIRFDQRKVNEIDKQLSLDEKKTLKNLLKIKAVNIYSKGQHKEGVYTIPEVIYPILKIKKPSSYKKLSIPDYLVVSSEQEATELSKKYAKEIKTGLLMGVRDMKDRNYYIVSNSLYSEYSPKISSLLEKKPLSYDEIIQILKINPTAGKAILCLMNESGEIYLKDKKYHLA
ncbi:hypothetical protein KO465_01035 [Candidatus Micrarchaeota archaeon]|nr:hypothetical protein [Candidatus Micrarchaeota archaeon]